MFIELTDILRCPRAHAESYLVLAPRAMEGRRVIRGVLGCPVCQAEYPIVEGVVEFGSGLRPPGPLAGQPPVYDAGALLAFFDLAGPGGYVCVVGGAARHAAELAAAAGVHVVAVNPPDAVAPRDAVSVLRTDDALPIKGRQVRAVALGAAHAAAPWLDEAVRVLLPGLRLVVEDDTARPVGATDLARGAGLLVAEKSGRG